MDLTYAYGQLPQNANTSKHFKFSLVGVKSKGTYRFKTVFFGLTTMGDEGVKSKGTYRFKTVFFGLTTMFAEIKRVMNAILPYELSEETIAVERLARGLIAIRVGLQRTTLRDARQKVPLAGY